jgi:hypothetical protein
LKVINWIVLMKRVHTLVFIRKKNNNNSFISFNHLINSIFTMSHNLIMFSMIMVWEMEQKAEGDHQGSNKYLIKCTFILFNTNGRVIT